TEVLEAGDESDHAVPAHRRISGLIEEDHARDVCGIRGWQKQCADEGIGAARLTDDRGTEVIEVRSKPFGALGNRAGAEVRRAVDDDTGGLTRSMRVDHPHHSE